MVKSDRRTYLTSVPKKSARPRDMNQLAVHIGKIATGEIPDTETELKSPASNGGFVRAANLSPKRRKDIARKAAKARWREKKK